MLGELNKAPWERIEWSPETVQKMYRDWGLNCVQRRNLEKAQEYLDKCLELQPDDHQALFYRSQVKRHIGQSSGALKDSIAAARINSNSATIDQELCSGLYEQNELEKFKAYLHENTRKYLGHKRKEFKDRILVVNENFNDSLGDSLTPFILGNRKVFDIVVEEQHRLKNPDRRPLWKKQIEQDKCDVLSVLEKEETALSPREIARRHRASRVVNQIYLGRTWRDVQFIKDVRNNPNLLLNQAKNSSPQLDKLTKEGGAIVTKFLKNLQTRSPLYNEMQRRCPHKEFCEKHRQDHLYRVQNQTRRNMLSILRNMRELRVQGKIEKLSNLVEEAMGDYVVLKTHRVMPWKLEFVHEVYNMLALAHADRYMEVKTTKTKSYECLMELLHMPPEKQKGPIKFVFGDRSSFQEPDAEDKGFIAYKKFIARMEKRMCFTKHCLEKSYLMHEIARMHMKQYNFDECCSAARKAIEEAKHCGSNIWEFLSTMLIYKSNAVLHKIERSQEVLGEAELIAYRLKSSELLAFLARCKTINDDQMAMKKVAQSQSSMGSRRSSLVSRDSSRASRSKVSVNLSVNDE